MSADEIGRAMARAAGDRIDAMLTEALVGPVQARPIAASATLTMEAMLLAYDAAWNIPDEPYWYLCHPDDLERVRAAAGTAAPGKHTCPIVRASDWCPPGKMLRLEWDEWAKAGARRQGR